jgi:outer membrane protein assembly factor BamB
MKNLIKLLTICYAILAFACSKDDVPTSDTPTSIPIIAKSSAKVITKFSFAALSPAVDATIDITNKTISATLPSTADLTKLVPTITVSDKATISPASGVAQDFSTEVSYTVTAEDGSTAVWKVDVKKEANNSIKNELVFSGNGNGNFYAWDAETGTIKWNFKIAGVFGRGGTPVYNNGTLYIVTDFKEVYAINALTGEKKWEKKYPIDLGKATAPIYYNEVVYFGKADGKLYALDALNGNEKWTFKTNGAIDFDPIIYNGMIYFTSNDGNAYAIDAKTGEKKWSYLATGQFKNPRSLKVLNKKVFVANGYYVLGLNADNGEKIWEVPTKNSVAFITLNNDVVYASGEDIIALDAQTGSKHWSYSVGGIDKVTNSPQVANGLIYCGAYKKLFSLDLKTGLLKWVFPTQDSSDGSPVIANGILYFGEYLYNFYALNAITGSEIWKYKSTSNFRGGACVLDKEGKIFYSGNSGMAP